MGRLVHTAIGSLDGFVADRDGDFSWSAPDEEVHAHVNDQLRATTAELYGRRLYEVMRVWETFGTAPDDPAVLRDFGEQWRGRPKTVFSRTLSSVTTSRTTLLREFDPEEVRRTVDQSPGDVSIGGPHLAAAALRAGIVDALVYYANPVVVGGGTPWLPPDVHLDLRLVDHRRFAGGVVLLAYEVRRRTGKTQPPPAPPPSQRTP